MNYDLPPTFEALLDPLMILIPVKALFQAKVGSL